MTNECRRAVEYWWVWSDIEEYLACTFIEMGSMKWFIKYWFAKRESETEREKSHWHVCNFTKAWREIKINFFIACKVKSQLIYTNRYLTTHFRCQSISEIFFFWDSSDCCRTTNISTLFFERALKKCTLQKYFPRNCRCCVVVSASI